MKRFDGSWIREHRAGASRTALWLLAAATLAVSGWLHWRAAHTLPYPWVDEPWFLWTGVELADTGGWASTSLRPGPALVISQAHALANAAVFEVFGVSLWNARWLSWACMAASYLGVLSLVRGRRWELAAAGVVSWFAIGPPAIVAGNMGRPEAMLWACAVWGYALLSRRRIGAGLALLGMGVNLHALGGAFFAGGVVLAGIRAWEKRQTGERWTAADKVWLVVAALALAASVAGCVASFDATVFADASAEDGSSLAMRLWRHWRGAWLVAAGVAGLASLFGKRQWLEMASLAFLGMAAPALRNQVWYLVYEQQALGLLAVCAAWTLAGPRGGRFAAVRAAAGIAAAVGIVLFACQLAFAVPPWKYPCKFKWMAGMKIQPVREEYLTEEDVGAVAAEVARQVAGRPRPVRVLFIPAADGLWFHGRLPEGVIPYQGMRTDVKGDVVVVHFSPVLVGKQRRLAKHALSDYGWDGGEPFRTRGAHDLWFFGGGAGGAPADAE